MNILDSLRDFHDLKKLNEIELETLCRELRDKILNVTLRNGGHLSASLGVVELTVALLRAFNPDNDKLIFDVGHQSYAYKILTDRKDSFDTLRQKGGIAGFSRLNESPYDFFTTGHSSTSISAALGYAKARDLCGEKYESVAVIGDGALLNGVAFEALNSIDNLKTKVIIVLNDNKMSISPRVGGMARHLAELAANPTYVKLKNSIKAQCMSLENGENLKEMISGLKSRLKSLLLPVSVFEDMNISYWGPFDGHNIAELESVFKLAKNYNESLLIHVITKKGKGFEQTEKYPSFFHGIGPGTDINAAEKKSSGGTPGWSSVMSETLCELAAKDDKIIVCTAAMKDGTKLGNFSKLYPDRFFDTGIAEEHSLVYAAGLAAAGMKPVVCIYSTFLQRAADQIVHDIALPQLPVLLGIDRAGLVGEDGETHHGVLDVSWLRAVPGMTIAVPRDAEDMKFFVMEWSKRKIPMAIRYPRGKACLSLTVNGSTRASAEWGKLETLHEGNRVCLIGAGSTVDLMIKTSEEIKKRLSISPSIVDLRFVKPFDTDGLDEIFKKHEIIVTAEENELAGGWGEAISSYKELKGYYKTKIASVGVPDKFISHATRPEQWEMCGLTAENIADIAAKLL